jgi:hypothetical protein
VLDHDGNTSGHCGMTQSPEAFPSTPPGNDLVPALARVAEVPNQYFIAELVVLICLHNYSFVKEITEAS